MSIKLEEHKVYVDAYKMEMVPYSVALDAIVEAVEKSDLDNSLDTLKSALDELKKTVGDIK